MLIYANPCWLGQYKRLWAHSIIQSTFVISMSSKCKKCKKDFNSPVELLQHRMKHCKSKTCSDCGSTFSEVRQLNQHLKNRKLIRCNHCNGKFCNNDHFQRHQRTIQKAVNTSVPDLNQRIYPVSGYLWLVRTSVNSVIKLFFNRGFSWNDIQPIFVTLMVLDITARVLALTR